MHYLPVPWAPLVSHQGSTGESNANEMVATTITDSNAEKFKSQ